MGGAVEKYLHRHGINAAVDPKARDVILGPLLFGLIRRTHELSLMVPIALTHFELERELLSNLVFESFWSCGDLAMVGGFNSVFERDACDDFGEVVKAA